MSDSRSLSLVGRILRGLPALLVLTASLSLIQAVSPAVACACGAPAPVSDDPNGDVLIGHEYAVISVHGSSEQIDMRLTLDTVAKESGLIMPTPAPATVTLGDATVFDDLAVQMTPRIEIRRDWWVPEFNFGFGSGAPNTASSPPVQVLAQVQLGPLEATTLSASDTDGLAAWLTENGYGVRDEVKPLLATYVDRGWYFVAVKLTNDATLDGDLDPIRFTFDMPETGPVYPLMLSQAARVEQTVNLYVFDDHQRDVSFSNGKKIDSSQGSYAKWAGPVDQPGLLQYGAYLTAFTLYFYDPATQIKADLVFPPAAADTPRGQVAYDTINMNFLGIPLGWLIVAGSILVIGLTIYGVKRARARSSRLQGARA